MTVKKTTSAKKTPVKTTAKKVAAKAPVAKKPTAPKAVSKRTLISRVLEAFAKLPGARNRNIHGRVDERVYAALQKEAASRKIAVGTLVSAIATQYVDGK